ncbi:MAG: multidrug effflux MFS transporter [Proteobacteria bacterium]|nr:multidrug effflux MFS transporter [Pseudomonadota bacterium]
MSDRQFVLLVIILGLLFMLGPISLDAFVPAARDIADAFDSEIHTIEISIAVYTLGTAIGQLIYGPLSDRFGRRPVILVSLGLYFVTVLGGVFAPNMAVLIGLRFIQGVTTHAGRIIAPAIARDLFEREQAGRLLSYVMFVGGLGPIFAPVFGGFLTETFGWQAGFILMAAVCAVASLAIFFLLQETLKPEDRQTLNINRLGNSASLILRNRTYLGYMICSVFCIGGLYAFLTAVPGILQVSMGVTPTWFGLLIGMIMLANIAGPVIGARLISRFGIDTTIIVGGLTMLVGGGTMIIASSINQPLAVTIPTAIYITGFALVFAPSTAAALNPFPQMAGTASSLMGFTQQFFGATMAALISFTTDGTQLPLALVLVGTAVGICVIYGAVIRPTQKTSR